jgi:hypothetical protein
MFEHPIRQLLTIREIEKDCESVSVAESMRPRGEFDVLLVMAILQEVVLRQDLKVAPALDNNQLIMCRPCAFGMRKILVSSRKLENLNFEVRRCATALAAELSRNGNM